MERWEVTPRREVTLRRSERLIVKWGRLLALLDHPRRDRVLSRFKVLLTNLHIADTFVASIS